MAGPSPAMTEKGFASPPRLSLIPHQPSLLSLPVARAFRLPLVVQLLAARQRDLDLRPAALVEIDLERHDRHALALHGPDQLVHLALVQQQFARAPRLVVEAVRLEIFGDIGVKEIELA